MRSGYGKRYVIYLILILAGLSLSLFFLNGPLREAAQKPAGPVADGGAAQEGDEQAAGAAEKVVEILFRVFLICTCHFAAKFLSDPSWRRKNHYVRDVRWTGVDVGAMVLLFIALIMAVNVFLPYLSDASGEEGRTTVEAIQVSLVSQTVVLLFGIAMLRQRGCQFTESMGLTARSYRKLLLIGIVAYLAFFPLHLIYRTVVLAVFYVSSFPIEAHPVIEELVRPDEVELKIWLALSVVLAAPFFEEVFFRGFLYQAVRKRTNPWVAIVTTALLFACFHGAPFQVALIFPLGVALAFLMEKTGSIIPCIVVHFLINGMSLLGTLLAS